MGDSSSSFFWQWVRVEHTCVLGNTNVSCQNFHVSLCVCVCIRGGVRVRFLTSAPFFLLPMCWCERGCSWGWQQCLNELVFTDDFIVAHFRIARRAQTRIYAV